MRFGLFMLGEKPPGASDKEVFDNILEEARWADELGYDAVWLAEHHFAPYGTMPELTVMAAAIAAATERVRIGTACIVPAFHDPITVAERIAMVDVISGGRFEAGFGRGYQQREFKTFGVPMGESTERFRESVTIIDGLLSHEGFSYQGKYYSVDDVTIYPRPLQDPRPPIYCTVMKTPSSFEWIAERGYNALIGNPYHVDPEIAKGLEMFIESHRKRGLSTGTESVWGLVNAFVHEDAELAREYPRRSSTIGLEYVKKYSDPFEKGEPVPNDYAHYADWYDSHDKQNYDWLLNLDMTLIGDPDTVIAKLRKLIEEVGWSNLMLNVNRGGAMERERVRAALELFAERVIPVVQEIAAEATPRT